LSYLVNNYWQSIQCLFLRDVINSGDQFCLDRRVELCRSHPLVFEMSFEVAECG
jgi:hypothetical protein